MIKNLISHYNPSFESAVYKDVTLLETSDRFLPELDVLTVRDKCLIEKSEAVPEYSGMQNVRLHYIRLLQEKYGKNASQNSNSDLKSSVLSAF
ncbi:hypothetical protein CC99x_004330 [Candidatus Berkiella cookevillensis]|uniref:Uncharacterized protein n=1 Tax=Candidatus Berkiella cookevillensis TaxID=437022 RepID=A0A0Q9YCR1_9GAMM|nr:hypothetical protein [Candidatus Berkiella cookevillensis]MCS5708126.1 hypothetical protein [Candidatus Berkiella cookevillensis]